MSRNRRSDLIGASDGDHGLRDLIDRKRLEGLATVFIGISQLPLAFVFADAVHWSSLFVVGCGGWLLVGIGVNLSQGREAFESGWEVENERLRGVSAAVTFVLAVAVAASSVWLLVT